MKFLAQKKLTELFSGGKWKSLGDLLDVYKGSFGVPYVSISFRIIYQTCWSNHLEIFYKTLFWKFCKIHWKIPGNFLWVLHSSSEQQSIEELWPASSKGFLKPAALEILEYFCSEF